MKRIITILALTGGALAAAEVSYTYDKSGRLTSADYGNGMQVDYRYSSGGSLVSRVVADTSDADNDGMADSWELVHFLGTGRTGSGDFDGDGATDADEFEAGTDPTSGSSKFRVVKILKVDGAPTELSWSSVPGKRYLIQFRDDLAGSGWSDVGTLAQADGTVMSGEDPGPFVGGRRFYRILVTD